MLPTCTQPWSPWELSLHLLHREKASCKLWRQLFKIKGKLDIIFKWTGDMWAACNKLSVKPTDCIDIVHEAQDVKLAWSSIFFWLAWHFDFGPMLDYTGRMTLKSDHGKLKPLVQGTVPTGFSSLPWGVGSADDTAWHMMVHQGPAWQCLAHCP
jgi:hypothetical protein